MSKRYDLARKYTHKYKNILNPCKYCGNPEIVITTDRGLFVGKYSWSVNCSTTGCDYVSDTSIKKAVAKWNEKHNRAELN